MSETLREALVAWLIEQAEQAKYGAEHPSGGSLGDTDAAFDKGARHMAEGTLSWIGDHDPDRALRDVVQAVSDKVQAAAYHRNYRQACIDINEIVLAALPSVAEPQEPVADGLGATTENPWRDRLIKAEFENQCGDDACRTRRVAAAVRVLTGIHEHADVAWAVETFESEAGTRDPETVGREPYSDGPR
jgi:hypothetical protein